MLWVIYVISLILSIIGIVVLIFAFRRFHKYQLISDTPTSKIRSMAMGLVEIQGNISGTEFIKSPFSKTDCVYYRYRIEEYRRHVSTDSKGRKTVSHSWDTIASGERRAPFFAKDDTGEVYVQPRGAEINAPLKKVFYQRGGIFGAFSMIIRVLRDWDRGGTDMDVFSWNLEPLNPQSHFRFGGNVGDRKYYEYYLEHGDNLFLLGTAAFAANAPNNVWIRKGDNEPTFMISYKSEKTLLKSLIWQIIGLMLFGCIFIIIGVAIGIYLTIGG
jgi:hypothetical protein